MSGCDFCINKEAKGIGLSYGLRHSIPIICNLCSECYGKLLRGLIEVVNKKKNVWKETMKRICNCKDKKILVLGDGEHIATEAFCPICGYQNTCCLCNPDVKTTECCRGHRTKGRLKICKNCIFFGDGVRSGSGNGICRLPDGRTVEMNEQNSCSEFVE